MSNLLEKAHAQSTFLQRRQVSSDQLTQPLKGEALHNEENVVDKSLNLTVAIPTYNGAERLPKVLDRLRSQINTEHIAWEVIVSDNNSTDNTAEIVRQYQQDWPSAYPLRYCFAAEQGAACARHRAVDAAHGELVAFLDDDNLPASDWIEQAYQFGRTHPKSGAFGSQIHGEFEGELPQDFKKIACFLAIIERGAQPHRYEPSTKILPPGAGLVVRRKAWRETVPPRLFLNNKGKEAGLASEDLEAILYIQKQGWEIWYNPEMVVYHQIPNNRLQKEYLLKLFRCIGLSRFYIRMLGVKDWNRLLVAPAYIANDLRKLVIHVLKNHHKSQSDLLTACEREHLISTVISPFFLLKKGYRDAQQDRFERVYLPQKDLWIQRLTQAFEQNQFQFQLFHQQTVAVNETVSSLNFCEILLRLIDKEPGEGDSGLISPYSFLPVAEHCGLIRTIDRWVLRKFFEMHPWTEQLSSNQAPHSTLYSINLSEASVCDSRLADFISEQLTRYNFPAQRLCFEISEGIVLNHLAQLTQLAHALKELGCQLAIDDVGAHRFPQPLQKQLPINFFKLNGNLVQGTANSQSKLKKTQAIIQLGHQMGIQSIAKGVETDRILAKVKGSGVDYAQGYRIAKPQPLLEDPQSSPSPLRSINLKSQ